MSMGFGFNDFGFSGFGIGFSVFQILFTLAFILIFGVFIVTAVKGIRQWNKNNHSPRLTVAATVIAKRTNHTRHAGTNGHHHSSTSYYATFQVESGDRMELHVSGSQYGLIVEGDQGKLTFQGTRFLNFERQF